VALVAAQKNLEHPEQEPQTKVMAAVQDKLQAHLGAAVGAVLVRLVLLAQQAEMAAPVLLLLLLDHL
jgi:hypothetical protein